MTTTMKCHYEVLGIPRDAEDDQIKKSYRKLALKYHPDKNPDNIDEVTRIFHQIQQAYEVLTDPQERAWYDKHREAILKGGLGHGDGYEDTKVEVFPYFNTSCYSGYGDDEKGFYAVYKDVFCRIYDEDSEFMDDQTTETEYPVFGDSESEFDDVSAFYGFWESYFTAKSYVWVEKYDTREAPSRQIRRLMEQDNKKLRDKARKERNEEVRALVSFVKKRDKRVQAHKKMLEERANEIAKLAQERKERDRQDRLKKMDNYKEAEWSATPEHDLEALEARLDGGANSKVSKESDEEEVDDGEEEPYFDDLYCVACNKEFKTEKAFANHEKSKKHRENIEFLKAEMAKDDETMEEYFKSEESEEDLPVATPKSKMSKKQKKRRKQQQQMQQSEQEQEELVQKIEKVNLNSADETQTDSTNQSQDKPTSESAPVTAVNEETLPSDEPADIGQEKTGQVKKGGDVKVKSTSTKSHEGPWLCNKCGEESATRNKLFDHIKATGHALRVLPGEIPPSQYTQADSKKGKKKKKGGKK